MLDIENELVWLTMNLYPQKKHVKTTLFFNTNHPCVGADYSYRVFFCLSGIVFFFVLCGKEVEAIGSGFALRCVPFFRFFFVGGSHLPWALGGCSNTLS